MLKPSDAVIRPAVAADIDAMIDLLQALFALEQDFDHDASRQRRGLALLLSRSGDSCIMVAERAEQVIGMGSVQLLVSTAEGGLAGLVEDVIVAREHSGLGIGKALLTALERWAKAKGATRLQLLADRHNTPALDFYADAHWATTQLICLRKLL